MLPASYGIIGYPLAHSFSAVYFAKKFAAENIDATYTPFPLQSINEFNELLIKHPGLRGLSVTIPHKTAVIPFLDALDDAAKEIGAVNSIAIKNSSKKGYNTDVIGFEESLKPLLRPTHKRALVLGTGGASKAVCYVLKKLGIEYQLVSRTGQNGMIIYDDLNRELIQSHTLIINTTPLGMYPAIDTFSQLPYEYISAAHLLYDLVYNPAETKFLVLGKRQGATIKNGLDMLHIQAEASWKIWNS